MTVPLARMWQARPCQKVSTLYRFNTKQIHRKRQSILLVVLVWVIPLI